MKKQTPIRVKSTGETGEILKWLGKDTQALVHISHPSYAIAYVEKSDLEKL